MEKCLLTSNRLSVRKKVFLFRFRGRLKSVDCNKVSVEKTSYLPRAQGVSTLKLDVNSLDLYTFGMVYLTFQFFRHIRSVEIPGPIPERNLYNFVSTNWLQDICISTTSSLQTLIPARRSDPRTFGRDRIKLDQKVDFPFN